MTPGNSSPPATSYLAFETKSGVLRGLWHLLLRGDDADIPVPDHRMQSEFYDNQRVIVESLQAKGALRQGLDVKHAADVLWTLNHPDTWQLLGEQRGWTPDEYEQWFGDAACSQLLEP